MTAILPVQMNEAQRTFVDAAETLGAMTPAGAVPLTSLPRLSARELSDLVDVGLVREAANWSYYVYRSRRTAVPSVTGTPLQLDNVRVRRMRIIRTVVFWVIAILIPVVFLQFASRR